MSATRPATELSIGIMARCGRAILHRLEGVLEGAAGQRFQVGVGLHAGNVGIGAGFALIGNLLGHIFSSRCGGPPRDRRRIHAQRHGVDPDHGDFHAVVEGAHLFQPALVRAAIAAAARSVRAAARR